ncbi:MAG: LCP family protein [Oscillospiraceae bacterium]|jgi:LCP family protein required for cell wall assembly|nr:LCP family protein [Oscillospiraceae bacterium]
MKRLPHRPRDPRRAVPRWVKLLCAALALLLLLGTPPVFVLVQLSKVNHTPPDGIPIAEEALDTTGQEEAFAEADAGIRANLANVMWSHPDVYNVLLTGLDYGEEETGGRTYSRTDAMLLVSANKQTRRVSLVSISRATYVTLPGRPNGRINAAHAYGGPEYMVQCVEDNYRIRVDRYMTVNFAGFERLINILGGVSVTLSQEEYDAMHSAFSTFTDGPGAYELNGAEALAYARLRYFDSDRARTQRQRNILLQIGEKARRIKPEQARRCVNAILPLVTTDMGSFELLGLLRYAGYSFREAIIPKKPMGLTLVDETEVILLDWQEVREGIHALLYPGLLPQES